MQTLNAAQARKQLYQILKQGQKVIIEHAENTMVIIAKSELDQLEREALAYEMDRIRATEEKFTEAEVNAMLAKVMHA